MNTLLLRGGCRRQPPLSTKVFIFEPGSVRNGELLGAQDEQQAV